MRKRIFEIIEKAHEGDIPSAIYDFVMMFTIIAGLVPLGFKEQDTPFFLWMEFGVTVIFIIDYILRYITADFRLEKKGLSFVLYPFTPMAIIDILAILPSVTSLGGGLRLLKILRLLRTLRVLKFFRYSRSVKLIVNVFRKQKKVLYTVMAFAAGYVLLSALIIFNVEPQSFETFFDAVYWATVSLTTVGYGDIYAVTLVGRIVTMASSVFGIAIIALPSGIITAGVLDELRRQHDDEEDDDD